MNTNIINPNAGLENHIECLYSNYAVQAELHELASPALFPELMFSFGDYFKVGSQVFSRDRALSVEFYRWHPMAQTVMSSGKHWTFGVLFKPWALALLESCDGEDLRKVPLNGKMEIVKNLMKSHDQREGESWQSENLDNLLHKLNHYLTFRDPGILINLILAELEDIRESGKPLRDVAQTAGISHKSVIAVFKNLIGVTPLRFIHYKAILHSLTDLRAGLLPIAEIALDNAFFDQSHYNRVFKSFMGVTPGKYRQICSR